MSRPEVWRYGTYKAKISERNGGAHIVPSDPNGGLIYNLMTHKSRLTDESGHRFRGTPPYTVEVSRLVRSLLLPLEDI